VCRPFGVVADSKALPPPKARTTEDPSTWHGLYGWSSGEDFVTNNSRWSRVIPVMGSKVATLSSVMTVEDADSRLESLFDLHHERLYRLARRLSINVDDAKDLVQETYLRAAQKLAAVPKDAAGAEAWLVRVLVNICRDRWRRDVVRRRFPPPELLVSPSDEGAMVAKSTIWRALQSLSPRRRAVVVMCELEDMPIPLIARTLGLASVTVRWHLSKGRRELASFIEPKGGNHDK
jgi:RNA polymerase sigma-70 factor, ECF subfamily